MSKASNRIVFILGFLGVTLLTGCGVTSTKLPSNLQPGGGGFLTIGTTQFPDAISGRSYHLVISTTGGSGVLSNCAVVSGHLPSGLAWSVSSTQSNDCILSGNAVGAPGTYSVVVQATDTSSPPKTDQLPYTLTVRNEFSITQVALVDAVQGRTYGISPLSQVVTTNLVGASTPQVGQPTEFGNGPLATCNPTTSPFAVTPSNPGLTIAGAPTQSQCVLTSTTPLTTSGAFTVTVSVTDNPISLTTQTQPVVPANTITKSFNLNVNTPISFSANFDNYSYTPTGAGTNAEVPDAVLNRTYGAVGAYGTAAAGGKSSLIFTATGGLLTTQGLTFTPPAHSSLPAPVECGPATSVTYPQVSATAATMVCNSGGTAVTASPGTFSFGVTVADVGNAATPPSSISSDALGHSSHSLIVDPTLVFSLAQAGNPAPNNPATLLDAVTGRTYGVVGGTPTYTPTGGLGANSAGAVGNSYYQWCISTGTLPATFSAAGSNLNTPCTAQVESNSETLEATSDLTQVVAGATPFPFTVQLNDTGNPTTPSVTLTNSTTLTVQPPLMATLAQATNATPTTALLPGVFNRTYGVVGGTPTFTAAGGLGQSLVGLGHYQWCVSAGTLPTGFLNTGTNVNTPCTAPDVENTATLAANPITQNVATATPFPFTVRLDDQGNPAVPSGVSSGTINAVSSSILVNPQIQLAQSLTSNWPDAVSGRPYGSGANCTGGTCAPAIYTATNGLGGYVWPATTPASIAAITGITCPAVSVGSATYTCNAALLTAPPTAAGTASISYSPSAMVTDTPNAAVPAATTSTDPASMRTDTLWVNSPLQATLNQTGDTPVMNPSTLLPGVANRSYGVVGGTPSYAATGGLGARTVTTYEWCVNTGTASLPGGITGITVGGSGTPCSTFGPTQVNSATLSAANITATITPPSQAFPFTVELDDTGNASTPSSVGSTTSATNATSVLINSPLAVQLTQTGNGASPNPPNLIPGVTGRSYATISGGSAAPTYTASYGLGGYVYPATPGPFGAGSGFTCSSTSSNPYSCSAGAVGLAGSGTPYGISLTVNDTANPAVPHGSATSNTNLLINPEMTVTAPASVPVAVHLRAYGTGTGCTGAGGNCAPLQYSLNNGLGNYTLVGSSLTTPFDTFTLSFTSPTYSFSDAAIAGAGGTNPALTFTGAETGNAATPGNTVTDTSRTLPTHAEMTVTAPTSVVTAVHSRAYGTGTGCSGGACTPLQYSLNNGLGNYSVASSSLTTPSDAFTCTLASPTFSCSKPSIAAAGGTNLTLTFIGGETGNASTPSHSVTDTSKSLSTNSEMTVTAPASVPTAVHGRRYGTGAGCSGGSCVPLTYTLTNGLGNYTATGSSLADGTDTFALSFVSPTFSFSDATITGAGGTTPTLTFTGAETGNPSTPGHAVTDTSKSLTIDSPVAVNVTIDSVDYSATAWPVGVNSRAYGTGSGCTGGACHPPVYTATDGLGGYTFSAFAGLTGMGFTCSPNVAAPNSTTLTCSANPLTAGAGTYSPTVTATDNPNASTPSGSTTLTGANDLTVNPELTITNAFLENATVGEPYSATLDSNRQGIGAPYVWCAGTISAGPTCTTSGGIAGVSFVIPSPAISDDPSGNIRGYYEGTPTTSGAVSTTIRVADGGNVTTPSCATAATCPSLALTAATNKPKVFAHRGFVANYASNAGEQGDNLMLFDANFVNSSTWLTLDAGGGGFPVVPRVTPDGQWVYVTKQGNQKVSVVDSTTGLKAITDFGVSNTGTFNPTGLDIEPQRYFANNPNTCATHCSNLNPFIRYDAYLSDPTDGSQTTATIEPIPDAENPGALPGTLSSGNALTVANANNIAISTDGTQAFLTLNYLPSGTACGLPPCDTLAVLSLPALSPTLTNTSAGYYSAFTGQTPTLLHTFGLRAGAVAVDPRGNYVASATRDNTGTYTYITVTSTGPTPAFVTYIPTTAGPTNTVNVCSASGIVFTPVAAVPTAITVSPDGNRLFVSCLDTATPQVNNTVGVWNISGTSMGVPFIQSIALPASSGAPVVNAENGCTTPVDVKVKLTNDSTTSTYGTRLFVSCQDSDTVVPIDYNSVTDAANVYASVVSTDGTPITNATLGNSTAAYTNYACSNNGSCPQLLDLTPNPSIHFTTGGYGPTLPFILPGASIAAGSYQYYVVAQGGAVPRTFSETTAVPILLGAGGSGACQGFSLSSSGLISGTPTNTGSCGPFTIRVTDGSTPGQFVERTFTLAVGP